jgi:hypothetical protein
VEIRVSRADAADSVLAHQDCCVCVMDQIAGKPGKFADDQRCNVSVTLGRNQNAKPRRGQQDGEEPIACLAFQGLRKMRGCVVTRVNSYTMDQVTYHASGRRRRRSIHSLHLPCQSESASAA